MSTQRRPGKHLAASPAPARRPARPGQTRKQAATEVRRTDTEKLYRHFVPYIEEAHQRNERSLKAGVWLLVLLPVVLGIIRGLTDASKIVFLIIWIFGMFGIATALIFTAYSDHGLKKTLSELKEILPPEEDIEIGNLLPVDAEGEGWLIDPEELPIPLPDLAERLPRMGEELKERRAVREAARRETRQQRREAIQELRKEVASRRRKKPDPDERPEPVHGKHEAPSEPRTEAPEGSKAGSMMLDDQLMKDIGKKHPKQRK